MLGGNDTIDYDVGVQTPDVRKTSAVQQGAITSHLFVGTLSTLHGSTANNLN